MNKQLVGLTGPSAFTNECIKMVEDYFNLDFILLYHEKPENLKTWINRCDAFVVSGGVDIHPSLYEQNIVSNHNLSKFDFARDLRELQVVEHALNTKKPMLGICRGHQLIGLKLGLKSCFCLDLSGSATIHQTAKSGVNLSKNEPAHYVEILTPNAFKITEVPERAVLYEIMEEAKGTKIWVNSFHHQGIFYNPKTVDYRQLGIEVLGVAPAEKNLQIIELMRGERWLSCQWHPEYDYEENTPSRTVLDVFKTLVETK
jgi:putative glutamine amidotransferase